MTISRLPILILAAAILSTACSQQAPQPTDRGGDIAATQAGHNPAHPPIDCPLRQQGIDPANLKPFDDTEKYIAFLERPDRAVWQKPDDVVAALGLKGDDVVVDVGAGSGYFTFRLARALPRGTVIATDVEPEMVRHLHHKATTDGIANVRVVLAKPDDPGIPADADVVFICDVLHHVPDRVAWLGKVAAAMKPTARLVLVEFKEGKLPEGPPESVKLSRAQLLALASTAGLQLDVERAELLPYQTFLVFKKAMEGAMKDVTYHPIGVIHSPFKEQQGTPIQPAYAGPVQGRIVLAEPYRAALADLAGFERVWLLYDFDRAGPFAPKVTPYRDTHERGLFATRAPTRPNRIGISAVKLVSVESDGIVVEEIDVLDGTPLLDIKPYVPAFDSYPNAKAGWLDESKGGRSKADNRFVADGGK